MRAEVHSTCLLFLFGLFFNSAPSVTPLSFLAGCSEYTNRSCEECLRNVSVSATAQTLALKSKEVCAFEAICPWGLVGCFSWWLFNTVPASLGHLMPSHEGRRLHPARPGSVTWSGSAGILPSWSCLCWGMCAGLG